MPKKLQHAAYLLSGVAAVVAMALVYRAIRGIGQGAKNVLDKTTKGIADAIVDATHEGVQLADGIIFVLPSGAYVSPQQVEILPRARFRYGGTVYQIAEAAPPGSGFYRAVPA